MYKRFLVIALALTYGWPLYGLLKSGLDSLVCKDKSHRLTRILYHILVMMLFSVAFVCGERLGARLDIGFSTAFWANLLFGAVLFGIFFSLDLGHIWRKKNRQRIILIVVWWAVFSFGAALAGYPIPHRVLPGVRVLSGQFDASLVVKAYPGGNSSHPDASADLVVDSDTDLVQWHWLHRYEGSFEGCRLIVDSYPCGGLYIHYGSEARYVNICTMMYWWNPALFQMHLNEGEIWIWTGEEYFVYNIAENTLQPARPAAE